MLLGSLLLASGIQAADPAYYLKRSTWQDTILASLQSPAMAALRDEFPPFESGTRHGGQPPQKISIQLGGARDLYLFVTGIPDVKWGVADWADARLIGQDGSATSLSDSKNFKVMKGRYERNLTLRSGLYQKMQLAGRQFDRGLHVQANSIVRVPLEGEYARFEAWIGVDDWAGTNGTVRFSALAARSAARKYLFALAARDFPEGPAREQLNWEREDRLFEADWTPGDWTGLAGRYARACRRVPPLQAEANRLAAQARDREACAQVRALYYRSRQLAQALARCREFDFTALGLALEDLAQSFPQQYPAKYRKRFHGLKSAVAQALAEFRPRHLADYERVARLDTELATLKREALLANPLLDFDRLLVLQREPHGDPRRAVGETKGLGEFIGCPRQSSWANGTIPNVDRWENEIAVLSPVGPEGKLETLYRPDDSMLLTDVDLHWEGRKLLFSMPDEQKHWQIHELTFDPAAPRPQRSARARQLTPSLAGRVHNYDSIYLPNDDILFISTAAMQGVPCNASVIVGMMYEMDPNGRNIRQVAFEQDHDYTPSVLNNGRVLYLRWDYTDTPHVWNRLLMSMNPDGTGQMEYYGANSYWPNAIFFARAIPREKTRIVGIVTGHHEGRVGDLVIFDPAKGRHETQGVVQRIPGRGQPVEPKIEDKLTEHNWPKFLHPWPLSDHYFLAACKPKPDALWGIYLVDVFDNLVLIKEAEGHVLLEPIPLRARPRPPVIEPKAQPERQDALVYMEDVYRGPGLRGVPRGTVKQLRLFTYHFGYQKLAGIDHRVGADGPWEVKRVLGTVPVAEDGSALFHVPAKTPISFQPLDAEGKAVALMRSWMTAMPGENISCVGCHDRQSTAPPGINHRLALGRAPSEIQPWHGPVRGFSFAREVQPVLDQYCVACHNGQPYPAANAPGQSAETKPPVLPDLRRNQGGYVVYQHGRPETQLVSGERKDLVGRYAGVFEPSYAVLRQYVRVGGLESDLHLLPPREFSADTSELIQMLQKGHHNVQLDAEAWDRLFTWIDLNAPCNGTWAETTRVPEGQCSLRLKLRRLYGGVMENDEEVPEPNSPPPTPIIPEPEPKPQPVLASAAGWPFTRAQARRMQTQDGPATRVIDLGGGIKMELVRVPAGAFLMGDPQGAPDERPVATVEIKKAFWMGKCEVSNEQFAQFDASHDSRFEHRSSWIFAEHYLGWPLNRPRQPVVRVSWQEAIAFCQWLSGKLGETVTLPTEAQWEWACRAGTATPLFYGDLDTDFAPYGNLGDASLNRLATEGWRPKAPDLVVREPRFNDGELVTADIGHYQPNAWGLHDMHGNAAEWTRTTYQPYPYHAADGRNRMTLTGKKVVRGGSWRDRPKRCRSASRWAYPSYQKVFNVSFRVVLEPDGQTLAQLAE